LPVAGPAGAEPCLTHTQRHRSPCENDHDWGRTLLQLI
jgi:hypothetical protein